MIQVEGIFAGENLTTVLAEQAELIADIKTALESKAAASVETCTLTMSIQNSSASSTSLVCVLADGSFIDETFRANGTYVYTLPKPCCIGIQNYFSISGDYRDAPGDICFIYGDATVEGIYEDMGGGPA